MEKLKAIIKKYDKIICSSDMNILIDGCKKLIEQNERLKKTNDNLGRAFKKASDYIAQTDNETYN